MPQDFIRLATSLLHRGQRREPFEIPLFPLKTVLFPGALVPLKIFDPRYMEMASACHRNKKPFGVCLILEREETGEPAKHVETGCIAEINAWETPQLGGLQIQAIGTERFHIEDSHIESNGLIVASATYVAPEPAQALPVNHHACAILLRRLIEHLGEARFKPPLNYNDSVWVSYRLAELLPLKLSVRQNMLEMNDSQVRIEILHRFLEQQGLLV